MGGVVGETHMAATVTQIEPSGLNEGQRNSEALKVALASLVGSTIEWYDFFLYGTASALVFGDLNDPESEVSRLSRSSRGTKLLEDLGTLPKVTYLQKQT